jgi:hypothetical protein
MKAVIFIETKEGIQFKCDTFWSKSEKPKNAKIYSDNPTELKGWLQSVLPHTIYKNRLEYVRDKYQGAKLGYFTPDETLFESPYNLKSYITTDQLGKPTYLWSIKMNDISEWVIKKEHPDEKDEEVTVDVETESLGEFIDYKQTQRDKIISDVLKEKDPE